MCFTEFPTETRDEALQTLDFLGEREDELAVFIVGEFGLTHGSLVAAEPARFGIRETWEVAGDELGLGLFFEPTRPLEDGRRARRRRREPRRARRGLGAAHLPVGGSGLHGAHAARLRS
jgi:hypothetical protein